MQRIFVALCVMVLCLCGCSLISSGETPDTTIVSAEAEAIAVLPVETEIYVQEMETEEVEVLNKTEIQDTIATGYEYQDSDFVMIRDFIPDALVDLKYAQPDNFTGHVIYEFNDVYLRYGSVKKLIAVQEELRSMGLGIKIWDGFRPIAAQFKLWEIYPDDTYVANPNVGFSNHSRGFAVDLTLVDAMGNELVMPTEFDDFSGKADRNYSDCDPVAAQNATLLQNLMEKYGFTGYYGEWWHFNDTTRYEVEYCFDPSMIATYYADCEEYIALHVAADTSSDVICWIPASDKFTVFGQSGEFFLAEYQGWRGYIFSKYALPVA